MKLGDILTVKNFAFTNKAGGTGLSDWKWNEKSEKPITVKVIKVLDDYETGQHGWAIPVPEEKELIAYLDRNAKKGIPSFNRDTDKTSYDESDFYVLFVSKSEIIETSHIDHSWKIIDIQEIVKTVAEACEFDTEYDGRTETFCFYCGIDMGSGELHRDDCLHIKAQEMMKQLEKNEVAQENNKQVQPEVKPVNGGNYAIKYALQELRDLEGILLIEKDMEAKTLNKAITLLCKQKTKLYFRFRLPV